MGFATERLRERVRSGTGGLNRPRCPRPSPTPTHKGHLVLGEVGPNTARKGAREFLFGPRVAIFAHELAKYLFVTFDGHTDFSGLFAQFVCRGSAHEVHLKKLEVSDTSISHAIWLVVVFLRITFNNNNNKTEAKKIQQITDQFRHLVFLWTVPEILAWVSYKQTG